MKTSSRDGARTVSTNFIWFGYFFGLAVINRQKTNKNKRI